MLLVSLAPHPPLPDGIINDGSYFGVWLAQHGGRRLYAPEARVRIETPTSLRDHIRQRRRIHFGNAQVTDALGVRPSTLARLAVDRPRQAYGILRRLLRHQRNGWLHLGSLAAAELAAGALSVWDRVPPAKDYRRWRRIRVEPRALTAAPVPRGAPRGRSEPRRSPVERRVATLTEIAAEFGTGLSLTDLVRLLPREGPATPQAAREWLAERPGIARLDGEVVLAAATRLSDAAQRGLRADAYLRAARSLIAGPLHRTLPWTLCVCLTGSAAFGAPQAGDDLDLFVVVRPGALWWFLAVTYLGLRFDRWKRRGSATPLPCLNYVVDDREARRAFAAARGLLFAREALSAVPLVGEDYYAGLLAEAPWMEHEVPRLYVDRRGVRPPGAARPVRWPYRLLNAGVFPWVAAYLQLVGLYRNDRLERQRRPDAGFRTETRPRRMVYATRRFERLRQRYGPGAVEPSPEPTPARPAAPAPLR
jgi:hypothetical protein